MRFPVAAIILFSSVSCSSDRYLLATYSSHGVIIWSRYPTLEACEEEKRHDDEVRRQAGTIPDTRCTTEREMRR